MDKKTIIIIVSVVVVGILVYGYSNWRDRKAADQLLNGIVGSENYKVSVDGGSYEVAIGDPSGSFADAKPVSIEGKWASFIKSSVAPILEDSFGELKPVLYGDKNYSGQEDAFTLIYAPSKKITNELFSIMTAKFADAGYAIGMNTVLTDSGAAMFLKGDLVLTITYGPADDGLQQIMVVGYTQ